MMKTLQEVEKEHIVAVLNAVGTYDEAAKILGINIVTLYRKRVLYKLPTLPQHSGSRKIDTEVELKADPGISPSDFKAARRLLSDTSRE